MTDHYSAWNPGLESEIPPAYRELETIHSAVNVTSLLSDIDEIAKLTGLGHQELVVFRPERLALHELIVRVTADIVVREGRDETELGRNFRQIANTILSRYIQPHMAEIKLAYNELNALVHRRVLQALDDSLFRPGTPEEKKRGGMRFPWRRKSKQDPRSRDSLQEREHRAISSFRQQRLNAEDPLTHAIYRSLYRVLGSIAGNRGYLGPDRALLARLVCNHVCNGYGSEMIGRQIDPWVREAISREGYATVQNADQPLLISLKGASAAGKSSLRPMLRKTMGERGIRSQDYATISPDVWRRLLLDYDSLGDAFKYAGRLTSYEVIIIDSKLDHYIRAKADRHGSMPHLLVDRFRFDSFSTERISRILHDTYLKQVDTLQMYFVVTPPHATVERGWERGRKTGRYKAVEDFLDHSVEAYLGMPKILFRWLAYDRPLFRYEFLDNSVPRGTFPKTVAYGTQREMNIVDCSVLIDIVRYQKIDIGAIGPGQVYPSGSAASVANNIGFLKQCITTIPAVNFIDEVTGSCYVEVRDGVFRILDEAILMRRLEDSERAQIFAALAPQLCAGR